MELLPRITRAQNMDVLSSQANLAGYKAVVDGVAALKKAVPMMMTAAGTVRPAKVLILGAGVAGLQAIATAKRVGAIVTAFDVRPQVKEQVESLGASFIEVETNEKDTETKGGYAKEMSEEYKRKQADLIYQTVVEQDVVITTALIPGKVAPKLISAKMVKDMRCGSVIVDLATAAGGNCQGSQKDKVVVKDGVTIIGHSNLPSALAEDASQLYARNLFNFVATIINKKLGRIKINFEDEIIQGCLIAHDGRISHPAFKAGKTASKATKSAKK